MDTRATDADAEAPSVPGFELGRRIGRGATCEVWVAACEADGRRVALKVVHADLAAVEAAAREAALSANAASAHLVRIEACLPMPDGRVALVMPHLGGGSLDALVRARGHLDPGEVVTVLAPVASALARLHALGVVHGDVSPGNVLLDLDGRPHLGDLGVGRILGEPPAGVWGSDGYVAPEVVLGAEPSPTADVYSLGALGWLCLTGCVPGAPGLRPALGELAGPADTPELSAVIAALDSAMDSDGTRRPDADALAWALFAAATPLPIHLVKGDDDVSAVTYRLRAAAGAGEQVETLQPSAGRGLRWRSAELHGPARHGAGGRGPLWRGWLPWAGAVAAIAVGALMVAALGAAGPGWPGGRGAVTGPAEQLTAARPPDPRLDAEAPSGRPKELMSALVEARAAAFRSATPSRLREIDAPGSAAWSRDVAAVTELRRSGVRYVGLHHEVVRATTVALEGDRAVIRTRVDTTGYVVEGRTAAEERPPSAGAPVLVDLVRTEDGWRVSDLRAGG